MSFVWSDYLDLARELHGNAPNTSLGEAKLRSAISRAYYAAFNEAILFLEAHIPNIYIPNTGKAHEIVPDLLIESPVATPEWIGVGLKLGRLKRNRRLADYTNPVNGLPSLAILSLREAAEAIATLRTAP